MEFAQWFFSFPVLWFLKWPFLHITFMSLPAASLQPYFATQWEDSLWYSAWISPLSFRNSLVAFLSTFLTGDNCGDMSLKPFYGEWNATLSFLESEQKDFFSASSSTTIARCLFNSLIIIEETSFVPCMMGASMSETQPWQSGNPQALLMVVLIEARLEKGADY